MKLRMLLMVLASTCGALDARAVSFEGRSRACAGGVADELHTVRLRVVDVGRSAVRLEMARSRDDKRAVTARFVGKGGALTSQVWVRGDSWVRIRSGRRVEAPWLVARDGTGREVARRRLDFDAPFVYRRFSDNSDEYGGLEDTGLFSVGDVTKYFLKFRLRPDVGDVNGNWAAVRGHRLRARVYEVDDRAESGEVIRDRVRLRQFARVIDPQNPSADSFVQPTRADGSILFRTRLEARGAKGNILSFTVEAIDETIENPDDEIDLDGVPLQKWADFGDEKISSPRWLGWPRDLSARVLWPSEPTGGASAAADWRWRDVIKGVPGEQNSFSLREAIGDQRHEHSFSMEVDGRKVEPPLEGAFDWRFAPGGASAMFSISRWAQDMDNHHDLGWASLEPFVARRVRKGIFGHSERFSPDGARIAWINGSRDVLGSGRIGEVLSLRVMNTDGTGEKTLRTDDSLSGLAWTPSGDVMANVMAASKPGDPFAIDTILRFEKARGAGKLWQKHASDALPSPDGKMVAFVGRERARDGNWRDRSPALHVARSDGSARKTITRLTGDVAYRPFWGRDSRRLYVLTMWSESDLPGGIVSSPAYNARKPDLTPFKVQWAVWVYDVRSGTRRCVARWENLFRPLWDSDVPNIDWHFSILGTSRDGKYLLLRRSEYRLQTQTSSQVTASSLHALRLSDGRLLPLAVFASTFHATAK